MAGFITHVEISEQQPSGDLENFPCKFSTSAPASVPSRTQSCIHPYKLVVLLRNNIELLTPILLD